METSGKRLTLVHEDDVVDDNCCDFWQTEGWSYTNYHHLCGIAIDAPFEFNESNPSLDEGNKECCGHLLQNLILHQCVDEWQYNGC